MAEATYVICTLTSLASALLMMRSVNGPGGRLLFWGGLFFLGMAANNIALFANSLTESDWSAVPNVIMLISVAALLYGLIWDVK